MIKLYSGETKSARLSMAEFRISVMKTMAMMMINIIHSALEIPNINPMLITNKAASKCKRELCSCLIKLLIPENAYLKLASLFLIENFASSFFIMSTLGFFWSPFQHLQEKLPEFIHGINPDPFFRRVRPFYCWPE